MFLDLFLFIDNTEACDRTLAGSRMAQTAENPHCGSLSCSVCAEEPENLTLEDMEGNVIDSSEVAEFLDQITNFY
ncbi:unknown [Bacteroides sp. CAG:545]|nr:unknown [Bacteroides sp. CAG:545]